jgi:hypothetical protein
MKSLKLPLFACAAALLAAVPLLAQEGGGVAPPKAPRARTSPHETISAIIEGSYQNGHRMVIVYGRPYTKDPRTKEPRKIWGTLVPWDKVWRVGSDEATLMVSDTDLQFGDLAVPAGAYTLYMVPSESGTSKLVINKSVGQWGIPYPPALEKQEFGRVDMKKDTLNAPVDEFTMAIVPKQGGGGGTILLDWETTQYSVDFTVKK